MSGSSKGDSTDGMWTLKRSRDGTVLRQSCAWTGAITWSGVTSGTVGSTGAWAAGSNPWGRPGRALSSYPGRGTGSQEQPPGWASRAPSSCPGGGAGQGQLPKLS